MIVGRDIVTKFIGNSIRTPGYGSFVEEKMFETVFPEYQVTVVRFRDKKPDTPDFLSAVEKMYVGISWERIRLLHPDFDSWVLVICPTPDNFFSREGCAVCCRNRAVMSEWGSASCIRRRSVSEMPIRRHGRR